MATSTLLHFSSIFNPLFDALMGALSDHILDSLWADIVEHQYISAAGSVAFNLAFIVEWYDPSEVEPTLASKRRSK